MKDDVVTTFSWGDCRRLCLANLALAACHLAGCGSLSAPQTQLPTAVIQTEVERGPVHVSVSVEPGTVRLSDEPKLTVTVDCEPGVRIESPPFGDAVGDFLVRDFRESLPEMRENREVQRQTYTLEPVATGEAMIDPITVYFVDERPHGDGKRHEIETEALTIPVISMVGTESPTLSDLAELDDPFATPKENAHWKWWAGGVAAAVSALVGLWLVRHKTMAIEPEISPRQRAIQDLEVLWKSDLAQADVKEFYVQLTSIVRVYIESTTGIHAPERTTEEFLREMGSGNAISDSSRQRLKDFLEAADLVKFAAHCPLDTDVTESFQRARSYVNDSAPEPAA